MKARARDLDLPLDGRTGKHNAITDVPGVEVGYTTLIEGEGEVVVGEGPVRTGVTAILPRGKRHRLSPIWAGQFSLNGNGEMTGCHWIDDAGYFLSPICLTNTHSVGIVHHATVGWMVRQYPEAFLEDHAWALPVVAETYDGLTNDICGQHITEEHTLQAIASAKGGAIEEGNVGGGTGMMTYEFKGGTGTSSRVVSLDNRDYMVGALVQSNFGSRHDLRVLGVPVGRHFHENAIITELMHGDTGSIIVIVATNLPALPIQLRRIAKRAALGIGRTGTPGGHYSGDIFLAFSTGNDLEWPTLSGQQPQAFELDCINDHHFDGIYQATVQAVEEAVINAMLAAESMSTVKPPGYRLDAIDHERLFDIMKLYNRTSF